MLNAILKKVRKVILNNQKGCDKVAKTRKIKSGTIAKNVRPPLTPEAYENQMISLAMDLVKQRLIDGTASSQETTHFLKLGSSKAKAEMEKLKHENELLQAKTEALQSSKRIEELYTEAITAMKSYAGHGDEDV